MNWLRPTEFGFHPNTVEREDTRKTTKLNEVTHSTPSLQPVQVNYLTPHHLLRSRGTIADFITNSTRRTQLIRQRAIAKASLTRMLTFIETGDQKLNEIQVRFNKLPDIFTIYPFLFLLYLGYVLFIFEYAHLILLPYAFRLLNFHDNFHWLHVVISMHYVLDLCTLYKIWPVAFSKA